MSLVFITFYDICIEELINLFDLDFKSIVRLALTCKEIYQLISSTNHVRISYKGAWNEKFEKWFNLLWTLDLSNTYVSDVSALGYSHIHTLYLSNTRVSDVSALGHSHIHTLNLSSTFVSDVSALAHSQIHTLYLYSTIVQDLSALKDVLIYC